MACTAGPGADASSSSGPGTYCTPVPVNRSDAVTLSNLVSGTLAGLDLNDGVKKMIDPYRRMQLT